MGLLPSPSPYQSEKDEESSHPSSNHLYSDSSTSSLSSQPSLPSVPSLTAPFPHQNDQNFTIHHECVATLKDHSSYVSSLALEGKFLYSGSSYSEIRAWRPDPFDVENRTGDIVAISNGAVKSIVVSGDKIFSAHQDFKIRVWKIDTKNDQRYYKCIATLPTACDRFLRLFSEKNYVQVRRHKKCTWVHHVDTVSALTMSKDGLLLFSASWDRTFKVWRTSDFKCLESVRNAHEDAINAIDLSSEGLVYTGSADKKIKVWKKLSGEKRHSLMATMEAHKSAVNALALSPDGSVLYSGACDRSILVWKREAGVAIDAGGLRMVVAGALRGHSKAILCLAIVSDLVCSGSADNTVRIWRATKENYCCLAVLQGHTKPIKCITAAIDTNNGSDSCTSCVVYSGSLDCDIKIWKIQVSIL
ncbi:hypothetical protein K2173_006397 [Erythroxylum novogranatense]|uniref:Uncharacterized protein n=1 Tax=Erythroxylum novogranatense TaxID=1862640 RepID=A0AAV8U377_9ROSI|nr:hypothetical protein K2173_006397 [Erythroxylum novogranatense]